jgi:hypothetical protein
MAPGWNMPYCPFCGGAVKPEAPDAKRQYQKEKPIPNKKDRKRWERVRQRLHTVNEEKSAEQVRSEAFDNLRQASPGGLFMLNIITLGLRSIFWLTDRLSSLEDLARPEEYISRATLYIWLVGYIIAAAMAIVSWSVWPSSADILSELIEYSAHETMREEMTFNDLFLAEWGKILAMPQSIFPIAALCSFSVSFVAGKHVLFWARSVVADAIESDRADVIRTKAAEFAPSPFMLWFIGTPYLQVHLNKIARARNLASFKYSKRHIT